MKQLLLTLLLVSFAAASALADSPEAILKDYRKQASQAVERLNQSLEKAATPLITKLVASGDTAGAELLTAQLKDKIAGEPVPTPQASAAQLFSLYDDAHAKALAPLQKSSIARIESLLKTAGGPKLEIVTELGKVREEIERGTVGTRSEASPVVSSSSNLPAAARVAELVKKLGGNFIQDRDGDKVDFTRATLSTSDIQQICADKRLISFSWNGGNGLTDEGLAAFSALKNLDNLFLWSCGTITDAGLMSLASCEKLRFVNIGANKGDGITGTGFEALSQCKNLESLTLNFISSVQGANLRHLSRLKSLKNLSLTLCKEVKDADLDYVAQMSGLTNLYLGRTGVTNAGMPKLMPLKHLKELTVSLPLVSEEGVKALKKARPDLKVIFGK